jgi:16S rRNA processing protein RimM
MAEKVCIGAVAGAHGVRGDLRVRAFTARPEDVGAYGAVETEDGRSLSLRVLRSLKDGVVLARIAGVTDRDQAEALRSRRLYVPRAALPAPEEDEFYHADLIGLAVQRGDGVALGTVAAVHDFGAGDILDIVPAEGGESVLLPFTRETVPVVDLPGGRLIADPPSGLFEVAP